MGVETRRFLYATRVGSAGAETLRLGELIPGRPRGKPAAYALKAVHTLPGPEPTGAVPETWSRIVPSQLNRRMAALSAQVGLDFIDHNIRIVDMVAGAGGGFFNEHRFSTIDRASWTSTLFDAFLAAEAALGVPPATLATYDWAVALEGSPGANIPAPEIGWADDDTLVVGFRLLVIANNSFDLGEEQFRFRLSAADGFTGFTAWPGPMPPPLPSGPFTIAPPTAPQPEAILYKNVLLRFLDRKWPRWFPILLSWRRARLVAGRVS